MLSSGSVSSLFWRVPANSSSDGNNEVEGPSFQVLDEVDVFNESTNSKMSCNETPKNAIIVSPLIMMLILSTQYWIACMAEMTLLVYMKHTMVQLLVCLRHSDVGSYECKEQ